MKLIQKIQNNIVIEKPYHVTPPQTMRMIWIFISQIRQKIQKTFCMNGKEKDTLTSWFCSYTTDLSFTAKHFTEHRSVISCKKKGETPDRNITEFNTAGSAGSRRLITHYKRHIGVRRNLTECDQTQSLPWPQCVCVSLGIIFHQQFQQFEFWHTETFLFSR